MIEQLREYAAAEFVLSDNNLRSQLEQVERETGRRPAQLDAGGELPEELAHTFEWFVELSSARTEFRPLTFNEIESYFRLQKVEPLPVELRAVRVLDKEWLLHKANTLKN